MPYFLLAIGVVLVVTAVNNTYSALGSLLYGDFTGPGNFIYWIAAIIVLGGIGYYAPAKPISRAFLILIIVTMVLVNGGFAQNLTQAIANGPQLPQPAPVLGPTASSTPQTGTATIGSAVSAAVPFLLAGV